MPTRTFSAASATPESLDAFNRFVQSLPRGDAMRSTLEALSKELHAGEDVIFGTPSDALTPNQAARILGVSRAHLYKVLDTGALPFTIVGQRDRRIALADLHAYLAKTEELRRKSAEAAARADHIDDLAIDEM